MFELNVELSDVLTPRSCPKLLIHLIKYILYHSEQIPVNYDCLNQLHNKNLLGSVPHMECELSSLSTFKEMKANSYNKTVNTLIKSCENLFSSLETEFLEARTIREIVIMVGSTVVLPKKVFRVIIPELSFSECCNNHSTSKNLRSLLQYVISSDMIYEYFKDKVGPANVFILLKMDSNCKPKTPWFLLNESFKFSKIGKQVKIILSQPISSACSCLNDFKSYEVEEESMNGSNYSWYQSKESLKGLKNGTGSGSFSAVFNVNR